MEETSRAHHRQSDVVCNRPSYREARWERAVKVYTVNQESKYLLVQNVHALGVTEKLLQLFSLYGNIEEYRLLDEYPSEPYTDVFWIKFVDINAARIAKKKLDNNSFFGKNIHVCYAPEFESVKDTRDKLQQRRRTIASKTKDITSKSQGNVKQPSSSTTTRDTPQSSRSLVNSSTPTTMPPFSQAHQQIVQVGSQGERIPPLFPHLPPPPSHAGNETNYSSTDPNGTSAIATYSSLQPNASKHTEGIRGALVVKPSKVSQSEMMPSTSSFSQDAGLYSASGLSKSQRVAAFLSSSSSSVAQSPTMPMPQSLTEYSLQSHKKENSARVTSTSAKGAEHGLQDDGMVRCNERFHKTSESKSVHMQEQHRSRIKQQRQPEQNAGSVKDAQQTSPLLSGNKSLDSSIHSIRDHMNKVWVVPDTSIAPSKPPKPKKRKRI